MLRVPTYVTQCVCFNETNVNHKICQIAIRRQRIHTACFRVAAAEEVQPAQGILRPITDIETLKNLHMCNFEETKIWICIFPMTFEMMTFFQNGLNRYPKYPTPGPHGARHEYLGRVFGEFVQTI